MNIHRHIPNFLTCCNLLCGCLGIYFTLHGSYFMAISLIWAAMIFDFLDGFSARLLGVSSPIGKELDSLADMVTFGVLPGFLLLSWMKTSDLPSYLPFIALLVPVFSALRLARFNVDESQSEDFIGLATPANALFISSLYFMRDTSLNWMADGMTLAVISVLFSLMLVAPVRMFSLKTKSMSWSENKLQIIFLILALACLGYFRLAGLSIVIVVYILLSIFFYRKPVHNEDHEETL